MCYADIVTEYYLFAT